MPDTQKPSATEANQASGEGQIQGDGDYVAGRRFQEAERSFADKGPVERKAREAAEALEAARRETGEGKVRPHPAAQKAGVASDPHVDEQLDKGLEETFPASDPVSISPGAD